MSTELRYRVNCGIEGEGSGVRAVRRAAANLQNVAIRPVRWRDATFCSL
jgi:hypothetical protein